MTTQVVARAREHRDWNLAGSQLSLLTIVSVLLTLTLSAAIWLGAPALTLLIKVEPAHLAKFTEILRYTAIANLVLFPALVWEGIVKGFERYSLLRMSEFISTAGYVALTIWASGTESYKAVAYLSRQQHLAGAPVFVAASAAFKRKNTRFASWTRNIDGNCCVAACWSCRAS